MLAMVMVRRGAVVRHTFEALVPVVLVYEDIICMPSVSHDVIAQAHGT